jgi:hypothetical protein
MGLSQALTALLFGGCMGAKNNAESIAQMFQGFFEVMGNKTPTTIITDDKTAQVCGQSRCPKE